VGATLALGAGAAEEERIGSTAPRKYPLFVDRGMSLPAPYVYGTLGFTGTAHTERDIQDQRPPGPSTPDKGASDQGTPNKGTQLEGNIGFGVGLTKRFWIDGSSGALRVAPDVAFHSAQIGLNANLVDTPAFELDAAGHVTFASDEKDRRLVESVEPGLFAVVHVPHTLRVDAGLFFDVNPGAKELFSGRLPLGVGFQLARRLHAVVNTGVTIGNFAEPVKTTAIPAGLTLGWSDNIGQGKDAYAVLPSVSWPELVKPGTDQIFRPGYVTVGVTFAFVTAR
jgi:hypothetical protein